MKKVLKDVYIEKHPAFLLKNTYEYMDANKWLYGIFCLEVGTLEESKKGDSPVYSDFQKGCLTVKLYLENVKDNDFHVEKLISLIHEDYNNHKKELNE